MGAWENFKSKLKNFSQQSEPDAGASITVRGSTGVVIEDSGNVSGTSSRTSTNISVRGSQDVKIGDSGNMHNASDGASAEIRVHNAGGVEITGSGNIGLPPEEISKAAETTLPVSATDSGRETGGVSVTARADGKTVTARGNRIVDSANITGATGEGHIDAPGADIRDSGTVTPPPSNRRSGGGRGR